MKGKRIVIRGAVRFKGQYFSSPVLIPFESKTVLVDDFDVPNTTELFVQLPDGSGVTVERLSFKLFSPRTKGQFERKLQKYEKGRGIHPSTRNTSKTDGDTTL